MFIILYVIGQVEITEPSENKVEVHVGTSLTVKCSYQEDGHVTWLRNQLPIDFTGDKYSMSELVVQTETSGQYILCVFVADVYYSYKVN